MHAPNEAADQAAHVWKQLDAMYAKSPKDYKSFISKLHREAEDLGIDNPLERVVRGRFCIQSAERKGRSSWRWFVNLCESARVKPPKDAQGAVSVVMSKARTGVEDDDDGSPYDVYDAVVNPSIIRDAQADAKFRADLIELALGCVEESFGVKLDRAGIKITKDTYKGLYGWDDVRGRPLKHGVESAQPPDPFGSATTPATTMLTPQSLLARFRGSNSDSDSDNDEGDKTSRAASRIPLLRVPPRENAVAPAAGAIQDLNKLTPHDDGDDKDPAVAVEPRHVEGRSDDGSWVLEVQLPNSTTAIDIHATVLSRPPSSSASSSTISMKTQSCRLTRSIPADTDAALARARFLARCSVLQIMVPRQDAVRELVAEERTRRV
ncbi:PIH1 domain-containing protein 2 [Geranomyces variabilis]|uniref:PIH1 domain-containing protein 2 n=1 Tax=Geranomyces variabilis TaxID=109894 RepID=A0AAD5XTQ6_9FUNG|nr:PIH1 domain-containing protein 2 [Geranomyces variabilis]